MHSRDTPICASGSHMLCTPLFCLYRFFLPLLDLQLLCDSPLPSPTTQFTVLHRSGNSLFLRCVWAANTSGRPWLSYQLGRDLSDKELGSRIPFAFLLLFHDNRSQSSSHCWWVFLDMSSLGYLLFLSLKPMTCLGWFPWELIYCFSLPKSASEKDERNFMRPKNL